MILAREHLESIKKQIYDSYDALKKIEDAEMILSDEGVYGELILYDSKGNPIDRESLLQTMWLGFDRFRVFYKTLKKQSVLSDEEKSVLRDCKFVKDVIFGIENE